MRSNKVENKTMDNKITYMDQSTEIAMAYLPRVERAIQGLAETSEETIQRLSQEIEQALNEMKKEMSEMKKVVDENIKTLSDANSESANKLVNFEKVIEDTQKQMASITNELRGMKGTIAAYSDEMKRTKRLFSDEVQREKKLAKLMFYGALASNIVSVIIVIWLALKVIHTH